ncbi:hypothetical protein GGR51DRAFT_505431 [Nemania sp. FL0031]|nr:hypothetical protein GGR51DRAFT_505431 [Nemania sp. FL0031]
MSNCKTPFLRVRITCVIYEHVLSSTRHLLQIQHMDSKDVLHWLTGVCSSAPLPPEDSAPVVWPPPQTRAYRLQVQREAQQQRHNQPSAVVKLDSEPLGHLNQTAKMPPQRRSPRKNVAPDSTPDDGSLQFGEMNADIDEADLDLEPQRDRSKGDNRNQRFNQSREEIDDGGPNMTSRSKSIFSQHFLPSNTSSNSVPCSKFNSATLYSQSPTSSRRARSKSPIIRSQDLAKLEKEVAWLTLSMSELRSKMQGHKSEALFDLIKNALDEGYLPLELRGILDTELCLNERQISLYAERPVGPMTESQLQQTKFFKDTNAKIDGLLPDLFHFQSLLSELESLRTIVARTCSQKDSDRTEASWNENVHRPMLDLAVLHNPSISIENVTRANITREFLPQSASPISVTPDSKLIDYAVVLNPEVEERVNIKRIMRFIDTLEFRGFNQSSYFPLRIMPSGIFIETKASKGGSSEGKARLGMWLASWYHRVSVFPYSENNDVLPPPVIPILLVESGSWWSLYFAFDTGSRYEICGAGISMGTETLRNAYCLLAVLRILAHWMATDFLDWVDDCLKQAGL